MAKALKQKRVVCIADMHCGHRVGLTPPEYQWRVGDDVNHQWHKYGTLQRECWDWYAKTVKALQPVDVLIVNGDCIDGRGEKSGGVELVTTDRTAQCAMAVMAINLWQAKQVCMVRGTEYHTGEQESWDDVVAQQIPGCKIGDHEWYEVTFGDKVVSTFDCKHFVAGSQVPYGRATAIRRDAVWNMLWADAMLQPRGDWIIRSHVHYSDLSRQVYGGREKWMVITPALQSMGSRFGARKCSGLVDFGLEEWVFQEDGSWEHETHIAQLIGQRARALPV